MASYMIVDPIVGVRLVSETGTFATSANVYPPVPFGYEARGVDKGTASTNAGAGVFVMCQGSNVASAGQFVQIQNNSAVLLASADSASFYPIGLAQGVISATNVYGWVQVAGKVDNYKHTNNDGAAGVRICLGSTAGQIGTVTALGSRIHGIIAPVSWTSTQSASVTLQLHRPFVIGVTASN